MFLERLKNNFEIGKPIFIEDILSIFPEFTRAYVFRKLKQLESHGDVIRFSRGVYCLPKKSVVGYSTLTSSMVANSKYVTDGDGIYGVYSGLALLNQFAITSQVPNVLEIVTNNEATRKRTVDIDGMKFVIRKSRFEITKDNYNYYTILQLFLELGINFKLDDFAKQRIQEYIKNENLNKNELLKFAIKFPAQALKNMIESGALNGAI